jgi:hypothetical protein
MTVETGPVGGVPTPMVFDGRTLVMWWGTDADDEEAAATVDGRVRTFGSVEACRAFAQAAGWPPAEESEGEVGLTVDFTPAQSWLQGRVAWPDPGASLDLWNVATDVARFTGQTFAHRGRVRNICHAKLTIANVPWLADLEAYRPTWSPYQLRLLRATLADAVRVMRRGLRLDV